MTVRALVPFLALALASCSGAGPADPAFAYDDPGMTMVGSDTAPPDDDPGVLAPLEGVDLSTLSARERTTFDRMVQRLYAPCAEQAVSISACVSEKRPCAACKPAADLVARKVRQGATPPQIEAAYAVRFGPATKDVDLVGAPTRGPENSPVTVVVYSDFQCPACRHAVPEIAKVVERYKVRLVHKFYPLKQHLLAEGAARAAYAALRQGKYWEMEKLLFEKSPELEPAALEGYARSLGLDMRKYKADVASEGANRYLKAHHDEAEKNGLSGTPFILINGRHFDTDYFRIDKELATWIATDLELAKQPAAAAAEE